MIKLITALALGFTLITSAVAQERHEKTTTTTVVQGRHEGFRGGHRFDGDHRHFTGFRGDHGRFRGWRGGYIGEIIILDDGCYRWDGFEWVLYLDCD